MTEEYESSPIIPVGTKKYFCVEYPGIVKREKRAIKLLGGEKALSNSLAAETAVELKFRPGDIFSHPINGHIQPTTKLLVKVTRHVKRNRKTGEIVEDAEPKWKTEIKGIAEKTLRFRGNHHTL
jgi:general transcription factor 3C polypeptide 5 (transcription factor C subunit 1)